MNIRELEDRLNQWGQDKVPFLFAVDFEMQHPGVWSLDEAEKEGVRYQLGKKNTAGHQSKPELKIDPISFQRYKSKFDKVFSHLSYGDSFLTNLTIKSRIESSLSLSELYDAAHAEYKFLLPGRFLVFSPECFVRIRDGKIYTYPMKGTIDADIPGAREKILSDVKELAEHTTIVDLMRNDLSRVATHVEVTRFRFVDTIRSHQKNLLQVSSEIEGRLSADYLNRLGSILVQLLPAGSVSGAPKDKTLEIIRDAEGEKRHFYTGVFGYFDGRELDSAVMIRFIEQDGDQLFYRSGGGITTQSVAEQEYQEVLDKIYVPIL